MNNFTSMCACTLPPPLLQKRALAGPQPTRSSTLGKTPHPPWNLLNSLSATGRAPVDSHGFTNACDLARRPSSSCHVYRKFASRTWSHAADQVRTILRPNRGGRCLENRVSILHRSLFTVSPGRGSKSLKPPSCKARLQRRRADTEVLATYRSESEDQQAGVLRVSNHQQELKLGLRQAAFAI